MCIRDRALDVENADDEELNAIFRCAHSIKGGAATFGFADVAELTHQMESLLDKLRRHELQPTPPMVDVLLESSDALKVLLARHSGKEVEPPATQSLVDRISTLAMGEAPATAAAEPAPVATPVVEVAAPTPAPVAAPVPTAQAAAGTRELEIHIGPLDPISQADPIAELFRDISGLGSIEALPCDQADQRIYKVQTTSSDADLLDLFTFHVSKEHIRILERSAPAPVAPAKPLATEGKDFGFFDDAPGLPGTAAPVETAPAAPAPVVIAPVVHAPVASPPSQRHRPRRPLHPQAALRWSRARCVSR